MGQNEDRIQTCGDWLETIQKQLIELQILLPVKWAMSYQTSLRTNIENWIEIFPRIIFFFGSDSLGGSKTALLG